jgi:hypothetical protein
MSFSLVSAKSLAEILGKDFRVLADASICHDLANQAKLAMKQKAKY